MSCIQDIVNFLKLNAHQIQPARIDGLQKIVNVLFNQILTQSMSGKQSSPAYQLLMAID